MRKVPPELWPDMSRMTLKPIEVWKDLDWLVQVYEVPGCPTVMRLSVNRIPGCRRGSGGAFHARDGITWDDLMDVKRLLGCGERWAVEVFPPDAEVVNVANMRHLWMLPEAPPFAWSRKKDRP